MKIYLTPILLLLLTSNSFGQASLSGKVTDADTGEPILFGDVTVYRNGALITGEQTDFDGNYIISSIEPGKYTIEFTYLGYVTLIKENINVERKRETTLDAAISCSITLDSPLIVRRGCSFYPVIEQDVKTEDESLKRVIKEEIGKFSTSKMKETMADTTSQIKIRGAKNNIDYPYEIGVPIQSESKQKESSNNENK